MSDTQSSGEQEVRVQQKMEAKLRDLLDRAKNITPFYDDDTLLLIYKDCFLTDHVFINKLEIIAKNHKTAKQEEDQDWIQFKQQQKVNHRNIKNTENAPTREKYNFLDDEELLQRAKHFDIEKQRDLWSKRKEDARERHQNKNRNNNNKNKYQQKPQKQEVTHAQKKLKFKEKVEPNTASSTNNKKVEVVQSTLTVEPAKPKQPAQQVSTKQPPKYAQKKQKYTHKKTETVSASNKQQVSKQETSDNKKDVKQHQKIKYQEKVIAKVQNTPKIQAKIEQKAQKEVAQPKQQVKVAAPQQKGGYTEKKRNSQEQQEASVKKEFEDSCRLNSFILKFIPPSAKLQKISYIRDPNGTYREVKAREPLAK